MSLCVRKLSFDLVTGVTPAWFFGLAGVLFTAGRPSRPVEHLLSANQASELFVIDLDVSSEFEWRLASASVLNQMPNNLELAMRSGFAPPGRD